MQSIAKLNPHEVTLLQGQGFQLTEDGWERVLPQGRILIPTSDRMLVQNDGDSLLIYLGPDEFDPANMVVMPRIKAAMTMLQ